VAESDYEKEEYLKFADVMMDRPIYYYAFGALHGCGIREGELLAPIPADFDLKKQTLRINKNYQRIKGKDVIQSAKTKNSVRTIKIPKFLCKEMEDCFHQFYHLEKDDRIFPLSKHRLYTAMKSGSQAAGVKKIRVHDLRHSHVSLLINNGFTAYEIGKRVGHSAEKITLRYAHLFPSKQNAMAEFLDQKRDMDRLTEEERKNVS
jgi:integrase